MTNKETGISGERHVNVFFWAFRHTVPCLFNRGCQEENLVRLHPIHPWRLSIRQGLPVQPQQWSGDGHSTAKSPAAKLSWKRHRDHMKKKKREYHFVLVQKRRRRTCKHVRMAGQAWDLYTHTRRSKMTSHSGKMTRFLNHHQSSCRSGIVTPVSSCAREGRSKEGGMRSCLSIVILSLVCLVSALYWAAQLRVGTGSLLRQPRFKSLSPLKGSFYMEVQYAEGGMDELRSGCHQPLIHKSTVSSIS